MVTASEGIGQATAGSRGDEHGRLVTWKVIGCRLLPAASCSTTKAWSALASRSGVLLDRI
jgi:hypothetical protein